MKRCFTLLATALLVAQLPVPGSTAERFREDDWARIALSPDWQTIVVGGRESEQAPADLEGTTPHHGYYRGRLTLYDSGTGQRRRRVSHPTRVTGVAFSPDGALLACGDDEGGLRLFSTRTWERMRDLVTTHVLDARTGPQGRTMEGHRGPVTSITFSSDSRTLASCGARDRTVKLWNVQSGDLTWSRKVADGPVTCLAFSQDGRTVAGGCGSTVLLWDVRTGEQARVLKGHARMVYSVAFLPDGRSVVSGSRDGTARLWDVETGALLRGLRGHRGPVRAVAVSPDGKVVASGSEDRTIRLWDRETGAVLRSLSLDWAGIAVVAFSPGGMNLTSVSQDGRCMSWDVTMGR